MTTTTSDTSTPNMRLFMNFADAFNARDWATIEAMLDPGIVDHHLPPEVPAGAAGVLYWLQLLADTLRIHVEVEQLVDAGHLVVGRMQISGTHVGDFPGLPATGRDFRVAMTSLERYDGGRLVERWETFDLDTMVAQLTAG